MLLSVLLALLFHYSRGYTIYTVDDPDVCNHSIYLDHGHNSAAILKMTAKESYTPTPMFCTVSFKVPIHNWSGLTGILEEVDLRVWDDSVHHLGQPVCVDHITVVTEKHNNPTPNDRQCGTWSVTPGEPLSKLGYRRALVGYCPHSGSGTNLEKCHVTEIEVIISVDREKHSYMWKDHSWKPHRGFTFVVTAYSYPIKNGETECRDGLRSCSQANTPGSRLGVYHCVHNSLWCDGHVNCGLLENMDEISCFQRGSWGGLITVVIGPWMGASILLLLAFCGILYWRSSRIRAPRDTQATNQDINSYAESYELSSSLSSAHHMAIQVRVVCNSNHPHYSNRGHLQPWSTDLPPSYEALFPQGPPLPSTAGQPTAARNLTASIIATVAGSSLGVNVTSVSTVPSAVATTASTFNSESVSTSSVNICSTGTRPSPLVTNTIISSSEGALIDLNVTSSSLHIPKNVHSSDSKSSLNEDARRPGGSSTQTSLIFTLNPNHSINKNEGVRKKDLQEDVAAYGQFQTSSLLEDNTQENSEETLLSISASENADEPQMEKDLQYCEDELPESSTVPAVIEIEIARSNNTSDDNDVSEELSDR